MAWQILDPEEERAAWQKVSSALRFKPSNGPSGWPGISEPIGSKTWSTERALSDPDPLMLGTHTRFNSALRSALCDTLPPESWVLVLDWQHPCYRFFPHLHEGAVLPAGYGAKASEWQIPVLADGDYYLFVAPDLSFGTFGHPWEKTLCVWGERLLPELAPFLDGELGGEVRAWGGTS